MSEQQPSQNLNLSDNSSFEDVQIGGIAGRDLNVTQIQGKVVYATVYDRIHAPDGLSGQSIKVKPLTQNEYRQRKVLLNKVKKFWIEGVLEKSLHNQVIIELGLKNQSNAISTPFPGVAEFPEQPEETLSVNANITEVFNQMGVGRTLLILGEPGSGKTITLLKLVQSLIELAEKDLTQLIPVVLNLSSWAIKQRTIKEWLIEKLFDSYGVSKPLGQTWIEEQQLILFLDGLDEVKAEYRNNCVQALNEFTQSHGITEIVVSCRLRDYETLEEKLKLQSAICIQVLTQSQIYQYLDQSGEQLAALRTLLQNDAEVRGFVTSPLILSVMSLAYQDYSLEDLSFLGSTKQWQQRLFDNYIERMFQRRSQTQLYPRKETMYWLNWLAKRMVQESQTVFLVEQINLTWLRNKSQKYTYAILHGLTIGQIMTLILIASGADIVKSLVAGILLSILTGLTWGLYVPKLQFTDTLQWSWKRVFQHIISPKNWIITVIASLISGYFLGSKEGFIFGFIFMNISLIIRGLADDKTVISTEVNQGIWHSFKNGIIFALVGVLGMGILAVIVNLPIPNTAILGLNFGLFSGFPACIQHFIVRFILYHKNYIPWNYARFLDYATDRLFMQKVGGGYIFVHRMLLEHFAQMDLEKEQR